ncbi:MAG: PAS domain-containing protein [Thiovulaceae bacterium]|nr:PAS domain-containing protein [Sulfurimonadaceae bacterium]
MEKPKAINKEYFFDAKKIITETDLRGFITYGNRQFYEVTGYTMSELHKQTHDLIRHPDMPSIVFEKMWSAINSGIEWRGFLQNLRKDGSYYWVEAHIIPKRNSQGEITGFISAQGQPDPKDLETIKQQYKTMRQEEDAQKV